MTTLLWTLFLVGLWNAINMVARLYCGVSWYKYWWSVFIGIWSAILLVVV